MCFLHWCTRPPPDMGIPRVSLASSYVIVIIHGISTLIWTYLGKKNQHGLKCNLFDFSPIYLLLASIFYFTICNLWRCPKLFYTGYILSSPPHFLTPPSPLLPSPPSFLCPPLFFGWFSQFHPQESTDETTSTAYYKVRLNFSIYFRKTFYSI
jgi:hypothetical protein